MFAGGAGYFVRRSKNGENLKRRLDTREKVWYTLTREDNIILLYGSGANLSPAIRHLQRRKHMKDTTLVVMAAGMCEGFDDIGGIDMDGAPEDVGNKEGSQEKKK